ncbi:MAG: 2-amino-4-hydroxy-6-hydroxymethyldihydropteridine diphosphokinase [Polyangiales bacterium]
METILSVAIVGVGTNLGAREAAVVAAGHLLDARDDIDVTRASALHETKPLGPPQGDYLNAALRLETSLSPNELLAVLLRTERRLGRTRSSDLRWGPRSVDLDLLWDERGAHESTGLSVPHPELPKRSFALGPLLEVAPELEPVYAQALAQAGGAPPRWGRAAIVRRDVFSGRVDVEVEADSMADACALSVRSAETFGRAWSTRHAVLGPSLEHFEEALRELLRSGFEVHCATISDCTQSQWIAQFHGRNCGVRSAAHVRLQTTPGAQRAVRVRLSIDPDPTGGAF